MQDTRGKRTNRQQRMSICQEGNVEWSGMVDWLGLGFHPFLWMRPSSLPAWMPTPGPDWGRISTFFFYVGVFNSGNLK